MPKNTAESLDVALHAAVVQLASPQRTVRETALGEVVTTATGSGRKVRQALGDRLVEMLGAPDAHTRSFAAVPLAYLASEHVWRRSWTEPFLEWFAQEPDQRGYDPVVGWIHAVAHGADVIGELGLTSAVPADRLLAAISQRLLHPGATVWRDQEEDRLALAAAQVLLQDDLSEKIATRWIKELGPKVAAGGTPIPAQTINVCRTLRSLYVIADGVVPGQRSRSIKHAGRVQQQIRSLLESVEPWLVAGT